MNAPLVLYRSNRWIVSNNWIVLVALVGLALRFSIPVGWSVALVAGYVVLVFALYPRALVVDDDGLATVPALSFLPSRRVRWVDARDLTWRTTAGVSHVFVRRKSGRRRALVALYALERGGKALRGYELCDLLKARWDAVTPAPELAERRGRVAQEAREALHGWATIFVLIALALTVLGVLMVAAGGVASTAGVVEIMALAIPAAGAAALAVVLFLGSRTS